MVKKKRNQEGLNTETGREKNEPEVTQQVNRKAMERHFLSIDQVIGHEDSVTGKKKCIAAESYVCIPYQSNTDSDLLSLWYVSSIVSFSHP